MLKLENKLLNNYTSMDLLKTYLPNMCKNIPKTDLFSLKNIARENSYRIMGNKVDIGQGCIFIGHPNQQLESYGFDTCAPFIMLTTKDGKRVLGHIDAGSTPQEIAEKIKTNFAPKEIENASFHYFRGPDTLAPGENLGQLAINRIEEALKLLGVKGNYQGRLTPFDKVIVDNDGIKLERFKEIAKRIDL